MTYYVLVFGRTRGELYSYDTSNGEQEFLGSCVPGQRVLPSRMASLQRKTALEYSTQLQTLLNESSIDVDVPIVVAASNDLPDTFVRSIVDRFRHVVRCECRVAADGQMGFNQVLREQLIVAVANHRAPPLVPDAPSRHDVCIK